ncbi:MAG: hypothetical protein UV88_C0021G0001, partial [Parcubacteria group bacterium GW2011_GWA1_43_21]
MAKGKKPKIKDNWKILGQFGSQILAGLIVLLLLVSIFSVFSEQAKKTKTISISELAQKITADQVATIDVRGGGLTITGRDKTVWLAKKETESSLSQTLINYG